MLEQKADHLQRQLTTIDPQIATYVRAHLSLLGDAFAKEYQEDILGDGPNLYLFTQNEPENHVDALGLIAPVPPDGIPPGAIMIPVCPAGLQTGFMLGCAFCHGMVGACVTYMYQAPGGPIEFWFVCTCYKMNWPGRPR